ncbi:MAG: sigma-54-dependent Fis family transcriptional regulator [Nitrospirae bacterium]|nr:sigma-54-dependent Fis family transcriptional regulator [Nitrospirota bacterium]
MNKILVVDDERAVRYSFERAFEDEYLIVTAENGLEAIDKVKQEHPDIVLMDIKMPELNGIEALTRIKALSFNTPVIIMTAFGDTDTAIEAMKEGAYDYITKPFENEELRMIIERALDSARSFKEARCFCADEASESVDKLIGKSPAMLNVCKLIGQVATADVPVLIIGESGVGKELIARAIHHHSRRKNKLFMAINCAALPENLIESELFGYESGAFTGAEKKRIGRFEQCSGGTIFLDEIADMSPMTQAKVLRILQDSTFERLGGNQTIKVDARVIAATNKNLTAEVENGRFRADLYHRLNVVSMQIPPLRDRKEDIPLLIDYFIKRANRETGHDIKGVSPQALSMLESYPWLGNVRELENTIRRAVILAKGDVLSEGDLAFLGQGAKSGFREMVESMIEKMFLTGEGSPYHALISEVERSLIERALKISRGNQVKASSLLGITRVTLRKKMEEYNINPSV